MSFIFKDVTIDLYYTCYQLSLVIQYIDVEYDGDDVECLGNRLDRSAVIGVSAPPSTLNFLHLDWKQVKYMFFI